MHTVQTVALVVIAASLVVLAGKVLAPAFREGSERKKTRRLGVGAYVDVFDPFAVPLDD